MVNDATGLVAYKIALTAVVTGAYTRGRGRARPGDRDRRRGRDRARGRVRGDLGAPAAGRSAALDPDHRADGLRLLRRRRGGRGLGSARGGHRGLYLGQRQHEVMDADLRLTAQAFWEVLVFALNAILFILLGLQFPDILERIGDRFTVGEIIGYGVLVSAVVIAVRLVWQFLPPLVARAIPAVGAISTGDNWRERLLIGWSGMRGAVSLAAALALAAGARLRCAVPRARPDDLPDGRGDHLDPGAPGADPAHPCAAPRARLAPAVVAGRGGRAARPRPRPHSTASTSSRRAGSRSPRRRSSGCASSTAPASPAASPRSPARGSRSPIENPLEGYRRWRRDADRRANGGRCSGSATTAASRATSTGGSSATSTSTRRDWRAVRAYARRTTGVPRTG